MTDIPLNESAAQPAPAARPSVLSLVFKEKAALYSAYMPFLKNGGIFVPTSKCYHLGDEVYLILTLLDDPNKYPIAGKVAWITPPSCGNGKAQGIGVHFPSDDSGIKTRARIEELLGSSMHSNRTTHTL